MDDTCPTCHQPIKRPHTGGGRVPYGFVRQGGSLVFSQGEAGKVLVWLLQSHQLGYTYREIADRLNAYGGLGPTGGPWSYQTVWRVTRRGRSLAHLIPAELLAR